MESVGRREFVEVVGAAAGTAWLGGVPLAAAAVPGAGVELPADQTVHLSGDGLTLSPHAYASVLEQLARPANIGEDSYLIGGEVERFEQHWAELLGKEMAVFMPSGTLANQLALRALAGSKRRAIVQETSHIYNDTGDACQTLSGLTLMPLGPNKATFTRAEVEAVIMRTASGRVATEVGAIAIESPVRRLTGQLFDWNEMQALSTSRSGSISTAASGRFLRGPNVSSKACSTCDGCSAEIWRWDGRPHWSRVTTWMASSSGPARRWRCQRPSSRQSAVTLRLRSNVSPAGPI